MKTRNYLFVLLLLFTSIAGRAQTISAEYPWRLQVDLTYAAGVLSAAPITQFYRQDVTVNGAVVAQPAPAATAAATPAPPASLTVDLVANGAKTVTVSGTTYTYAQAIAIIQAVLAQERAAQIAAYNAANPTAPAFTP